ncbi:alpha/beta-hydrolase [Agrocybe pediades]|nr:alpha/beta-hydrolase [Agrocybe pediades]
MEELYSSVTSKLVFQAERTLASGCAFISADYRCLIPATASDIVDDLKDVFKFVSSTTFKGDDYTFQLDEDRIGVSGSSAGGLCAYLATIHCSPRLKVLVSIYGQGGDFFTKHHLSVKKGGLNFMGMNIPELNPSDFSSIMYPFSEGMPMVTDVPLDTMPSDWVDPAPVAQRNPRMMRRQLPGLLHRLARTQLSKKLREILEGPNPTVQDFKNAIPKIKHGLFPQLCIDTQWPPTILIHGTADGVVPPEESRNIKRLVEEVGASVQLIEVEGQQHGDSNFEKWERMGGSLLVRIQIFGFVSIQPTPALCSRTKYMVDDATANIVEDTIPHPQCHGQVELPTAQDLRRRVGQALRQRRSGEHAEQEDDQIPAPLFTHLAHGLAYTTGSALGCTPPSFQECLDAFLVQNKAGLTAGARAWSKHSHRSIVDLIPEQPEPSNAAGLASSTGSLLNSSDNDAHTAIESSETEITTKKTKFPKQKKKKVDLDGQGFWGVPSGPVASINARALVLFHKICDPECATWRNLHWLPHRVLVYEIRVKEGYGMRWSQDWGGRVRGPWPSTPDENADLGQGEDMEGSDELPPPSWTFRGFVEPMMENGHELKWRHPA